jgi:hypothetical protein
MSRLAILAIPCLVLFVSFVPASEATVILDADFESPAYALGSIHTQNGWSGQYGVVNDVNSVVVHGGGQSLKAVQSWKYFSAPLSGTTWYMETVSCQPEWDHFKG